MLDDDASIASEDSITVMPDPDAAADDDDEQVRL